MDCRAVQEHAGDALDRSLPTQLKQEFLAHLEICRRCRNAYELEELAKHVIQTTLRFITTPPSVQRFVVRALRREYRDTTSPSGGWLELLFLRRAYVPALAGAIAVIVFVLFVSLPRDSPDSQTAHTASNDIINLSYKNFILVRSGQLKPVLVSCTPESVATYFKESQLNFAVDVIKLPDCEWYGAMASEYNGVKLAHVMYRVGEHWMYIYEVSHDDAIGRARMTLPPAAKTALATSGWYTDPDHPDCSVVVWKTDGTLCAAVSTMKKEKLLAMLTAR